MLTQKEFKAKIEEATRRGKTLWLVDEDSEKKTRGPKLVLKIQPGGESRAYWLMRYTWHGKRETWPFHKNFKEMGLAEARKEFRRLLGKLEAGGSLKSQAEMGRKAQQAQEKAEKEARLEDEVRKQFTLQSMLEVYISDLERQGKVRTAKDVRSAFKHLSRKILLMPARDVVASQVATDVRRVVEAGKERQAGVLRSYLLAAFNLAVRSPYDPSAPSGLIPFGVVVNPVGAIPAIRVKAGNNVLSEENLRAYLGALNEANIVDMALKVALLSGGQRMAQLLRAKVTDFDSATGILRLYDRKGRRAQPREHLIPLAREGARLVTSLVDRARSFGSDQLFTSLGTSVCVDRGSPGKRAKQIGLEIGAERFDLRDVRRTVESGLAMLKVSKDVRGQLLSHGLSGVQQFHYDRHSYLDEKRAALKVWERWLFASSDTRKVVPLVFGQ